jgi:hypothetical protein
MADVPLSLGLQIVPMPQAEKFSANQQSTTMKNVSSGMLRHVALVRTDVSEEHSASIIKVTRISELVTFAITSN